MEQSIMFKYTVIATLAFSVPAYADTVSAKIKDHYITENESVPITTEQCQEVQVPIYGRDGNFNTGGAVLGGLIGGILGNQVGGGSGKEAATGVGAMTGAIIGGTSGNKQVTGYRTEVQCQKVTEYSLEPKSVYSHSSITFRDGSQTITLNYQK
jgi:uncharacterized protein YcfJ